MRDYILVYINGKRHTIRGQQAFLSLSDYLRYDQALVGTKVVCSEGDCGACTVLQGSIYEEKSGKLKYKHINACIAFMYLLDGSHLVSVEGLKKDGELHPVQQAFVDSQGAQCGFCTPGFICSLAATAEIRLRDQKTLDTKKMINGLSGNLCRCTGYLPIIEACNNIDSNSYELLENRYHSPEMIKDLKDHQKIDIELKYENLSFFAPADLKTAAKIKQQTPDIRLISSATDLGVLINKEKFFPASLLNLNHVAELHEVKDEKNFVVVGARVNLTQLEQFLETKSQSGLAEIARMIRIFASPQIKNTATLVGNIANASPIADTIPAMMAMNAELELVSTKGSRRVPIRKFYLGYKKLDLAPDEIIARIYIPFLQKEEKLKLYKVSNRKDMDISTVTFAAKIKATKEIQELSLVYGGVGPVVQMVDQTQNFLIGKPMAHQTFLDAGKVLSGEIKPISDVRSSKDYRMIVAKNLLEKFYYDLGVQA